MVLLILTLKKLYSHPLEKHYKRRIIFHVDYADIQQLLDLLLIIKDLT